MSSSKFADLLPENYGYVLFTTVGSTFVNMWMAYNVGKARKQYEVEYPDMYSPTSKTFNCIQRAHQNTLENQPTFIVLSVIGGLQYPRLTAIVGFSYLVSRVLYAKGYYTGDPSNRKWGAWGHLSMLLLLGHTISFCAHQLKWVPLDNIRSFVTIMKYQW
ncbi:LOW QUALITY PROTEIN: glutathione S-transferase 3, mitochondrial-like [Liolophura sinensis]|uniref:LOW QUALITY PROTEIN: glutathione S-transferase 3, mitochondrial-like n=1 Tax=Liolophura sinensis TaxID=3198878 RepID=UPI0031588772